MRSRYALAAGAAAALTACSAEHTCTSITTPTRIAKPGAYCLGSDIRVTGETAIVVAADRVVLDLNGYSLICSGCPASTTANGIYSDGHSDITVKNGHVVGFFYGAQFTDSDGYTALQTDDPAAPTNIAVENVRFRGNYFRGVRVEARRASIRNNVISNTGGSVVYPDAYGFAIESFGGEAIIEGNWIFDTFGVGTGEGVGISESDFGIGTVIRHNRIVNASSYGVWVGGGDAPGADVVVDHNTITGARVAAIRMGGPGVRAAVTSNIVRVDTAAYGVWFSDNTRGTYGNNTASGTGTKYRIDTANVTASAGNY
jgi:hypothetical protein